MRQLILKCLSASNLYIVLTRELRSLIVRDKRLPKLVHGSVKTVQDESGDLFGPMQTFDDVNKKLKEMFIEPDDIQRETDLNAGDDYSDVFEHLDQMHDMHKRDESGFRKSIRKAIIKRNLFKEPAETNLLTHAAKIQIHYLHQLNPEEWSPEKLAECFPISISGVKKLLKRNRIHLDRKDKDYIMTHDATVAERWKCLKTKRNLSQFSPITLKLWKEGKLVQNFYAGNFKIPQPEVPKYEIITKPRKVGEFASIVKKYVDSKNEKEQKNLVPSDLQNEIKDFEKSNKQKEFSDVCLNHPSNICTEDHDSAYFSVNDNRDDPSEPDIPSDVFRANLEEEYSDKKHKTSSDIAYQQWLDEKKSEELAKQNRDEIQSCDLKDVISETKKYNTEVIELTKDYDKSKAPYLYNPEQGYQYPYGKNVVRNRIRIPKKLYKHGATYKVGLSYYNDNGYFMYKVPIDVNF